MSVGGNGEIQRGGSGVCSQLSKLGHQGNNVLTQERLATGQAYLLNAKTDENPDHPQVIGQLQLGKLRALRAGATVHAFVIATVGDGDAEIGDRTPELVF